MPVNHLGLSLPVLEQSTGGERTTNGGIGGAAPGNLGVLPLQPCPSLALDCPGLASLWTPQGGPHDPA